MNDEICDRMSKAISQSLEQSFQRLRQERETATVRAEKEVEWQTYPCRRCPEVFPSNNKLHKHLRLHNAKKPDKAVGNKLSCSPIYAIDAPPNGPVKLTTIATSRIFDT